jgi:hypothetical protein
MVVWNGTEYEKKQLPLGLPTEDDVLAMDSIVVFSDDNGHVHSLKRYGYNVAANFLEAICDTCHTDVVSEHEAREWGLAKMEDWKAWLDKVDEEWRAEQSGTIQGRQLR